MPARGGTKDFMPDGSWLQNKCIENFHQERERAISEARVTRRKDLVRGEWKPELGLVELIHEMKNFWEHMGFNDNKRKWLHPEEGLLLMETNILEIWYDGVPLSLQEAYSMLIGQYLQLEYYQVYAYLRRVGYVVLRHQGRYDYTKYERKIGLHKHGKKKKKGNKKLVGKSEISENETHTVNDNMVDVGENVEYCDTITKTEMKTDCIEDAVDSKTVDVLENSSRESVTPVSDCCGNDGKIETDGNLDDNMDKSTEKTGKVFSPQGESVYLSSPMKDCFDVGSVDLQNIVSKAFSLKDENEELHVGETCDMDVDSSENPSLDVACPKDYINNSEGRTDIACSKNEQKYCLWNFDEIVFPNFSSADKTVSILKPLVTYIPQGPGTDFKSQSYVYNKSIYINTKKEKKKDKRQDEKSKKYLEFSNPEVMTRWQRAKKSCKNWAEYKLAIIKDKETMKRADMFPHLYKDDIEPLVKPESAKSTFAVLNQLQVIKDYSPEAHRTNEAPEIQPDFDVYAPSTKFKKSSPGIPDFRVKVAR
ncbi:tRNA splicing endonuclease 54 [Mactra antiquata]